MKHLYLRYILAGLLWATFLSASAQQIAIDVATLKQKIDAIGGDIERSQTFITKAANPAEVMQWCFGDIPFNICRVSYDKKQELTEGVKDTAFYTDAIQSMKWVKQANPNIKFLATMKSDYDGFNEDNHNNLPTFIYDYACTAENTSGNCSQSTGTRAFDVNKFGIFLADYLERMHKNGVTISYLATAKEWQSIVTPQRSHDAYVKMKSECISRGVPVPLLIGPASWGLPAGVTFVNTTKQLGYLDDFYCFSSHNLGNNNDQYDDFADAAAAAGKQAWDDESSTGGNGRTSGVEPDIAGVLTAYYKKTLHYAAGYAGEVMFELTSRGVSAETRSVYFQNGQTGRRLRAYYIMKEFTKQVIGKQYIPSTVSTLPGVYTMAFREGNNLTMVVVNDSSAYASVPFNLTSLQLTSSINQIKWTNTTAITGESSSFDTTDADTFTRTLDANSISIFTCTVGIIPTVSEKLFLVNLGNPSRLQYTNEKETTATAYAEGTSTTATSMNAQWQFVSASDGWSYLKNAGSDRYLQCTNTSIDGGVDGAVQVYLVPTTNTGDDVQWKKVNKDNTTFYLLNKATSKYLQCTNASSATKGLHIRGVNATITDASTQWNQTTETPLSTEKLVSVSEGFSFYPNPSPKNNIHITLAEQKRQNRLVCITDLTGRQVLKQLVSTPSFSLDVAHLSAGMYLITIQQGNLRMVQRLMIE